MFSHPPETILEPCLSCGRTDQPERFHTHPIKEENKSKSINKKSPQRHPKSPLKENKISNNNNNNNNETDRTINTVDESEDMKDKNLSTITRRGRRSQSPKKSLSPEKSLSPSILVSQSLSPVVKRKAKHGKVSEKENDSANQTGVAKSPRKTIKYQQSKTDSEVKRKQNNDFTVDIFTSKSSMEKEAENYAKSEVEKQHQATQDEVTIQH